MYGVPRLDVLGDAPVPEVVEGSTHQADGTYHYRPHPRRDRPRRGRCDNGSTPPARSRSCNRSPSPRWTGGWRPRTPTIVVDTAGPLDVEYDAATRALALATDVGDESLRALCLALTAVGAFYTDFGAAWERCEQARLAAEGAGDAFALGGAQALQAMILHLRDRHADAEAIVDAAVRGRLRHRRGVLSTLLTYQASGALTRGDPARAGPPTAPNSRRRRPTTDSRRGTT